jgi:hypothetical protein
MMNEMEIWRTITIALLPALGALLGWTSAMHSQSLKLPRPPEDYTPTPLPPESDTRVFEILERIQDELGELSERQDFAERLLVERLDSLSPEAKVDTPV